jgi:hypothetical protein
LSLALAAGALAVYLRVPSVMLYAAHPWPAYALLAGSVAAAAAHRRRGWPRRAVLTGSTAFAALFVAAHLFMMPLAAPRLAVAPGDRFPDFTLPTSTGETFSPSQVKGRAAALYIFCRGDW